MSKNLSELADESGLVVDKRLRKFASLMFQEGFDEAKKLAVAQLKDTAEDFEEMADRTRKQGSRNELERRAQSNMEYGARLLRGQSEQVQRLVNKRTY